MHRARRRDHPAFAMTERFCNEFEQVSFDPDHGTLPVEAFAPAVERIFGREPGGPHAQRDWRLPD